MKKVILLGLVLALVGFVYFSYFKGDKGAMMASNITEINLEEEMKLESLEDEVLEEFDENLSLEEIDKALEKDELKEIPKEVVPEMLADVIDIMIPADRDEVEKEFSSKEGIKPVATIELAKNSISKLNVGDTISLPSMGNGQFDARITDKKTHKNGSVTVSGNLVDSENKYSVVLTEGKKMSFGTVTTPNGSYEIETQNGLGYVYATDDIDREWIDYGKSDTLIPDEHDH